MMVPDAQFHVPCIIILSIFGSFEAMQRTISLFVNITLECVEH